MKKSAAKNKVILIIRDGWGYSTEVRGNAVLAAKLKEEAYLQKKYPWTTLTTHGNAVGLPEGTQGGSEPGHLTMGAGRVVWQPFEHINRAIRSGEFFTNKALLSALQHCKKNTSKLHLMGLFSDQGIHGTTEHLYALIDLAERNGIKEVYIHTFLDGRDVPEKSARGFFLEFEKRKKHAKMATIVGRYYAMDRDKNWDRTKEAYDLLVSGKGIMEKDAKSALEHAYARGDPTDYYVKPMKLLDVHIEDNDAIIFWNFRSDRTRQITYAFTQPDFSHFSVHKFKNLCFVCMGKYDDKLKLPVAFPDIEVHHNLGQVISSAGLTQLRAAETEKYAHVTFFFNSQHEEPNPKEDRILVPSPKVPSYAQQPEMSAPELTKQLLAQIELGKYDLIVVNYANGDLVGHSADWNACIKACQCVDHCVEQIVNIALPLGYCILLTGDHGNVESMLYPNGEVCPAHGTNPVPCYLISKNLEYSRENITLRQGTLADVAPTILELMEIAQPKEMTGKSLIKAVK